MNKIVLILSLKLLLSVELISFESTLGILKNVESNSRQIFNIGQNSFVCSPYGVFTLEKIYSNAKPNSRCQKSIQNFYLKYSNLQQFAQRKLKVQQMYKIELKEKGCVFYSDGQKTYAEVLVENGLAVVDPNFADKEFKYSYNDVQKSAKSLKIGLWKERIIDDCLSSFNKK